MITPPRTSVVILITLAELAWLAAFGLLFAYRGKVGELRKTDGELKVANDNLAMWRTNAPDTAKLLDQLQSARTNTTSLERQITSLQDRTESLQARLAVLDKFLKGVAPEDAARRLAAGERAEKQLEEAERQRDELMRTGVEREKALEEAGAKLSEARAVLAKLQKYIDALPPNVAELPGELDAANKRFSELQKQLLAGGSTIDQLKTELRQREVGEFSVRRELTGLPDKELRRVVFLVDTSSSMRNSPAWESARRLIRTWLEFLPVEECAMVNFNDAAVGYPKDGYLRVRERDGTKLGENREELLRVFDQARPGTYTDLLRGLRRAYEYPPADVMVVFTDGHPHVAYKRDPLMATEIFNEVAKHQSIPLLTVALGSYEVEDAGGPRPRTNAPVSFLKELARRTGGNFLAR